MLSLFLSLSLSPCLFLSFLLERDLVAPALFHYFSHTKKKNVFYLLLPLPCTANTFSQPGGNIPMAGSGAPHQFGGFGPPVTVGHNQLPYGGGYGPVPNGALQQFGSFGPPVTVGHNQLPYGGGYGPVPDGALQQFGIFGPPVTVGHNQLSYGGGYGPVPYVAPQWYSSHAAPAATRMVSHFIDYSS